MAAAAKRKASGPKAKAPAKRRKGPVKRRVSTKVAEPVTAKQDKKVEQRPVESTLEQQISILVDGLAGLTSSALRLAGRTRDTASRAISRTPRQLRMMASAGDSLRDMREVLGLTVSEITEALNLKDRGVWQAIEEGREALSPELILRLASLYARNDPIPFVFKHLRTYQPRLWTVLQELGIDRFTLLIERERRFINLFRKNDAARKISEDGFSRVLQFTDQAFDLALSYVAEQEEVPLKPAPQEKQSRTKQRATSKNQ